MHDYTFESFLAAHGAQLGRAASYLAGADAEDLLQETLIAVFRRWRSLESPDSAHVYAYRCMKRRLARNRRKPSSIREQPTPPSEIPETAQYDEYALYDADLARCLNLLPMVERDIVVMRYVLDLPCAAVAELFDIPEGTVRSHSSHGLRQLRRELGELRPCQ